MATSASRIFSYGRTYGLVGLLSAVRRKLRKLPSQKATELPYAFVTRPIEFQSRVAPTHHRRTLNWVIPPFYRNSGGHRTLFRFAQSLEALGWDIDFYIWGSSLYRSDSEATQALRTYYTSLRAKVHLDIRTMNPSFGTIATAWETAYAVSQFTATTHKYYFVLDNETEFFAASAPRAFAEETYRFNFKCICAGPWLSTLMRTFGSPAIPFRLGYDPEVYFPASQIPPTATETVVFYARHTTPRRGVELGLLALELLVRRRPQVQIVLSASEPIPYSLPFNAFNKGILSEKDLADCYRKATVGLSLSFTNYSLVPQEMLACGLPVVELNHPSLVAAYPSPGMALKLSDPTPTDLADSLEHQLNQVRAHPLEIRTDALNLVARDSWKIVTSEVANYFEQEFAEHDHSRTT